MCVADLNQPERNLTKEGAYVPITPGVCPGCGRCGVCGQPRPVVRPKWVVPYWTSYPIVIH